MIVGHRKQFGFPLHYPSLTVYPLTLWAVPVSATIVEVSFMPAVLAFAFMSAKGNTSAPGQCIQGLNDPSGLWVLFKKIVAVKMNYIRDFMAGLQL